MVEIPHSLLDFADAIRMLAESQSDVAELVTKWDELCDTTTPKTIKITVGGVVHEVDNLAKIRDTLVKGLSLDNPNVKTLRFYGIQAGATYSATRRFLRGYHSESYEDDYGNVVVGEGVMETLANTLRTIVYPTKARLDLKIYDMPSVMCLGVPKTAGEMPIDTYDIYVSAPPASFAEDGSMFPLHYYTTTKFVNRNYGTGNPIVFGDVTINIHDATGRVSTTRVIPPNKCVEFLFFASPGQDTMNFQELIPDIPTA